MGLLYVTGLFMLLRQTAARWALAGAAVVLSLGFILSFSRGAYMSLAVGLVFFIPMALQWRIRKVILVVLAVAYVAVNALIVFDAWPPPPDKTLDLQAYSLLFPATQGRLGIKELMQKRFQDDAGRDAIWETARRAFHEHPVFGSGFHKASQTMAGAVRMDYKEWIGLIGESQDNGFFIDSFPHPHNFILHVLVELGLVGLVLMLLCYYFLFKRAREQLARLPAGPGRILVLLGTAYLVADLFHGVFEPANIFGSDSTWYAYLFNVALVLWGDGVAPEPALPAGFQAWEPDEKM
jgi:O-antigen ligase